MVHRPYDASLLAIAIAVPTMSGRSLTASLATFAWALRRDGRARPMESDVDRP
ncbi:hypothetical protein [Sphingomonas sp. LK11]|uniref:hypothetical protein n=1 Tax=Sphingomonas sp. LK11 TaxID=1390395 RepID=UPI0012EC7E36|nr:hypothetical protein [Sphingomonas sp. LK11]